MHMNTWKKGANNRGSGSSQQCPVTGQEVMGTDNTGVSANIRKHFFYCEDERALVQVAWRRGRVSIHGHIKKLSGHDLGKPPLGKPCFTRRAGQDDFQRSLSTSAILCDFQVSLPTSITQWILSHDIISYWVCWLQEETLECSVIQAHISSHPILWRKNSAIQLSHKPGFLTDTCLGTCSHCRFPKFNYNRVTSLLEWHETWEPALRNLEWKPEKTHISKYSQNVRLHRYNLQTQRKKYQKIFQIFITSYQRRWLFC